MNNKAARTDNLEKQIDAAIEAGMITESATKSQLPKKRGRPPTKSREREPVQEPDFKLMPEEKKLSNAQKVEAVISNTTKRRVIMQLQAFSIYFPDITREAMNSLVLEDLTLEQLQKLLSCFRDSVLGKSEILALPCAIKKGLGRVESMAVSVGMSNPDHPVLGEFIKMNGLSARIDADSEIDDNVKLIAVDMAGRLPRNPYFNILAGIWRCALDQYNDCSRQRPPLDVSSDPRYSKLSGNSEQ